MSLDWRKKIKLNQDSAKVLVLTLYSGENEFNSCINSLDSQDFLNFNHLVISGLGKKDAHDLLYRTIMENSGFYDYFLKLDADMVLSRSQSLGNLLAYVDSDELDKLTVTVFDFFTNSPIVGAHLFSNRVIWDISDEQLFTDSIKITYPGCRKFVREMEDHNILHASDPSDFQSFVFGVHRAMKAIQIGRNDFSIIQFFFQFSVLNRVYRAYLDLGDRRHFLALAGAHFVFNDQTSNNSFLKNKNDFLTVFDQLNVNETEVRSWAEKLLGNYYFLRRMKSVGFLRFFRSSILEFSRRIFGQRKE